MKFYLGVVSILTPAALGTQSPRAGFLERFHNNRAFRVSGGIRGSVSDDCDYDTSSLYENFDLESANESYYKCVSSTCDWDDETCDVSTCEKYLKPSCKKVGGKLFVFDYACNSNGDTWKVLHDEMCFAPICTQSEMKSTFDDDKCTATPVV
mmetsp:Transcript_1627/g.2071  ORF Transcript_1627/g.2071 Transcript_1627/m.2071 type:complete len:152 (-) Transcript_1627:162-617(-)